MEKYGAVNVEPATREVMIGYKQVLSELNTNVLVKQEFYCFITK